MNTENLNPLFGDIINRHSEPVKQNTMKTIKVKFHLSTRYVGFYFEKEVELKVDENISDDEFEKIIDDSFNEWVQQNMNSYYEII